MGGNQIRKTDLMKNGRETQRDLVERKKGSKAEKRAGKVQTVLLNSAEKYDRTSNYPGMCGGEIEKITKP